MNWRVSIAVISDPLSDQAHIESFFSHLKGDWPHLVGITDPAVLDAELARIRGDYNTRRLHASIGYVTPDDEHHGRGPAIRRARIAGLKRAHAQRVKDNRRVSSPKRPVGCRLPA